MDDDLEAIKRRQMQDLLKRQQRAAEPNVTELDAENFDAFVSSHSLVVADFWAEWCGPCKSMHPIYEKVAAAEQRARFARVNVDSAQRIAARYGVQSIPTFIVFRNGREAGRATGAIGESGLGLLVSKYAQSGESGRV